MKKIIFVFLSLLSFAFIGQAQFGGGIGGPGASGGSKEKVIWNYALSKSNDIKIGDTITLTLTGQVETDWYIYSNDFDPSLGPNLAEITFTAHSDYKTSGKTKPVGAKSHYEEIWGGTVSVFEGKATFTQKIIIKGAKPVIKGSVTYQACSSVNGTCLPPKTYDFEIQLSAGKGTTTSQNNTPADSSPVTVTPVSNPSSNQSVEALEKEKEKYTPRDNKGNDVSRDYLKNFVRRNGK